jgi:hypothetical protein
MREREGKVIVELVGCQYNRDDLPSLTPLVFLFKKNDTFVKSDHNLCIDRKTNKNNRKKSFIVMQKSMIKIVSKRLKSNQKMEK